MEAVPRLPMISFELKISSENVQFGPQLKQYIASFYNEDPASYNTEISNLEALRNAAVRPTIDVAGCQLLKKYYCQLHFLKSRFPMAELQAAAVYFSWKDTYSNVACGVPDIRFELMCILYNIGALHSQLGSSDSRTSPEGMKMACTHFQCAAWAFQTVKETYYQMVPYMFSVEVVHFMQQVCLAQAQECILEKSMMDNRKATIIVKVAVQVVDYYRRSLAILQSSGDESVFTDLVGGKIYKEWVKYLSFKISYHKCIALLFQGQQAEEQQKMGERVAFYQAACEQLEEARKLSSSLKQQKEVNEAIAFTSDVVEGKRKAAKNENEFIYHEEVPDKNALPEVKGASLVKGIPFNVNDVEVSGHDIFARLVPMEAHEASSLYSEKKAQMLRQMGDLVERKDQALAEFMSSLQLDVFNQMRQATGLSQELVDRAAALSAKPSATQDLVSAMGKLSGTYHEVESMLNEIQELLKEEEQNEKTYQELMGKRPPSIIATDLSREASKYKEAHNKANDSNQNLHKAMMTHVANLKILCQPLVELQKQIPSVELPNPNIDDNCIKEIETLIAKVEEMRNQRAMLWTQFREAVHKDDITSVLVTRAPDQPLDQLFQQELQKHQELASLIEQNAAAQENILKAFVNTYARSTSTRRYLQDIINKRNTTITALIASYDTYEDLLAKANKGIEFYNKLETNVSKLLQRIKSASKVQQEEREQMLLKNSIPKEEPSVPLSNTSTPKLKDYLESRKKVAKSFNETVPQFYPSNVPQNMNEGQIWPPGIRPAPLGSEVNEPNVNKSTESYSSNVIYPYEQYPQNSLQYPYNFNNPEQNLVDRMSNLRTDSKPDPYYQQCTSYIPQNYASTSYNVPGTFPTSSETTSASVVNNKAFTSTTDSYQPISSITQIPQCPMSSKTEYTPSYQQYAGYTANYIPPTNVGSYTQVPNSQPNVYYPSGYGPNTSHVVNDQTYTYQSNFGTAEYATSVQPNITNLNQNSTYSAPIADMKSSNSNDYVLSNGQNYEYPSYPSVSNTQQYQSTVYDQYYYGGNYMQNQAFSANTNVPVSSPIVAPQVSIAKPEPSVSTKESNIDLLTGLDFTVNQAPLIPQQKSDSDLKAVEKVSTKVSRPLVQKDEETIVTKPEKIVNRKPLTNHDVKKLFLQELEKFEKFIDVLNNKTLNGPTNLDLKWKEIQDNQDLEKKAISVARCYPMKNRFPDILPYDYSRVELKTTKDDYINASHIKDISYYAAPLIVTQAPIQQTFSDFWTMVREQQVELIVCLLSDNEIGNDIYWSTSKGKDLHFGGMIISLKNVITKPYWTERLISISVPEKRDSRVVIHLQFTAWPGSLFPTKPDPFIGYITEVVNVFLQQRNCSHPILVHCSSGIGRSGLACLLITAILEATNNASSIPDLVSLSMKLSSWRKNILRDREHLKFAFEAFMAYMKHALSHDESKTILNEVKKNESNTEEKQSLEIKQEIDNDPLSSLDPFWASKK